MVVSPTTSKSAAISLALAVSLAGSSNSSSGSMAGASSSIDTIEKNYEKATHESGDNNSIEDHLMSSNRNNTTNIIIDEVQRDLQTTTYNTLKTTYASGGASNGHMFNLKAQSGQSIILRGININTYLYGPVKIEIYVKRGNYKGYEKDENAWTLWVSTMVVGRGKGSPTSIPPSKFPRMAISPNEMRAFYIKCGDAYGACLLSTKEGYKKYQSDELIYYGNGASKRLNWNGLTLSPRSYNGAFSYEVVRTSRPDEPGTVALIGAEFGASRPTPRPVTSRPTPRPTTRRPTPRPATRRPTPNPSPRPTSAYSIFRIRLYWEEGYYWQESRSEKWWCMETSDADEGDSVRIDSCNNDEEQKWMKVGETYRPALRPSLCMTTTGSSESTPVRLYKCDPNNINQKFYEPGLVNRNERFVMRPKGYPGECLSQQHHPKADERVYPVTCGRALDDETLYWITY